MAAGKHHVEKLISVERIQAKVKEIAKDIKRDFADKKPLIVPILKGSFVFAADLVRELDMDFTVDFLSVMSYGQSTKSSGIVQMVKDLETDIKDRHVIIIEDILDSGLTLEYLEEYLMLRKPASLSLVALLVKDVERTVDIPVKYKGFDIPDKFVVGYGLDFAQKYRGLPYIGEVIFHDEVSK